MKKRMNIEDLPEFDATKYLDSEEGITYYLANIEEDRNPELTALALKPVAQARIRHKLSRPS